MIQLHGRGHQMFQSLPWEHSMLVMCPVFMDALCVFMSSVCVACLSTLYVWYVCVTCVFCACVSHVLRKILICVFCLHLCVLFIHVLCIFLHVLCFYTCFMHMFCACSICVYIYTYVCVRACMLCVLLWKVVLFHCPFCIDGKISDQYKREMIWVLYSLNFFLLLQNWNIPPEEKKNWNKPSPSRCSTTETLSHQKIWLRPSCLAGGRPWLLALCRGCTWSKCSTVFWEKRKFVCHLPSLNPWFSALLVAGASLSVW